MVWLRLYNVALRGVAACAAPASNALCAEFSAPAWGEANKVELTMIPYYVWANREAEAMQVWLRAG